MPAQVVKEIDNIVSVIPVSVSIVISFASFIVGFLINILVMRNNFVSAQDCERQKDACEKCRDMFVNEMSYKVTHLHKRIDIHDEVLQGLREFSVKNYGMLKAIASRLKISDEEVT